MLPNNEQLFEKQNATKQKFLHHPKKIAIEEKENENNANCEKIKTNFKTVIEEKGEQSKGAKVERRRNKPKK